MSVLNVEVINKTDTPMGRYRQNIIKKLRKFVFPGFVLILIIALLVAFLPIILMFPLKMEMDYPDIKVVQFIFDYGKTLKIDFEQF